MSLGIGVVYQFAPFLAHRAEADAISDFFKKANGEPPQSFTFAQFSDPHVGFQGPPDPLGTKAFESAVELFNKSPQRPDFVQCFLKERRDGIHRCARQGTNPLADRLTARGHAQEGRPRQRGRRRQ